MLKKSLIAIALSVMMFLSHIPLAFPAEIALSVDNNQVQRWNRFVNGLLAVHELQSQGRNLEKKERTGGYSGLPKFYREVEYIDADSGKLLSRIRRESANPNNIHTIEVFFYDDQGRVSQDFSASYLARYRNAPIQTLINLHHYNGDLHSFRQFDASDNLIYEDCQGQFAGKPVGLSLEYHKIDDVKYGAEGPEAATAYQACFTGVSDTAGIYINPHRVAENFEAKNSAQ
ncbi:MAG TPA: hypothetical protein VIR61_06670 [Sulfuricaulis sp.]